MRAPGKADLLPGTHWFEMLTDTRTLAILRVSLCNQGVKCGHRPPEHPSQHRLAAVPGMEGAARHRDGHRRTDSLCTSRLQRGSEIFCPQAGAGRWGSPGLQPLGSPLPLYRLCSPPREATGSSAYCQERQTSEQSKLFSMSGCFSHKISETEKRSSLCIPTRAVFFPFSRLTEPQKDTEPRVPAPADPLPDTVPLPPRPRSLSSGSLTQSSPSRLPQFPPHPCFPPDPS